MSSWRAGACLLLMHALAACAPETPAPHGTGDAPPPRGASFTDATARTGLRFDHFIGATGQFHFAEIMGSGCALLDYDGDSDLDVYLVQGTQLEPQRPPADPAFAWRGDGPPRDRLYRNDLVETGTLHFTDVTGAALPEESGYGMGAATGDYDNDGDVDLFVTNFGPDVLYRNDDGAFHDVTAVSGLADPRWTTSASWLDYDRDGWLDLVVVAYADFTVATNKRCFHASGKRDYCGPDAYPPLPARLWRNRGDGTFEDATGAAGMDVAYGHGLGVLARDFDGNGWIDVYVANDGDANQLWMNEGGTFTDQALMSGAALSESGKALAGMGVVSSDFDDDGDFDIFVTNLNGETNSLYRNVSDAFFEDATARHGLGLVSLPFTGFGVAWLDADHDADLDLMVVNGDVTMLEAQAGEPHPFRQTSQLYLNDGAGHYGDGSLQAGEVFSSPQVGRGLAAGDVDNDGDIDAIVTNNSGPAKLFLNELTQKGSWLEVRVLDAVRKRDAIGARVRLTLADGKVLTRPVATDGSYLSAGDPRVHLAWPAGTAIRALDVVMPDGRAVKVEGAAPGRIVTVRVATGGATIDQARGGGDSSALAAGVALGVRR